MTAKILSWTTFGLLLAGSVPFLANPEVAESSISLSSPYTAYSGIPIPQCGACNIQPTQEFQKAYAIDKNALCASDKPYRIAVRLSSKILCQNGAYWVCEDTSSMICSAFLPRPECPQDTCSQ
jgi:hypothetical protein